MRMSRVPFLTSVLLATGLAATAAANEPPTTPSITNNTPAVRSNDPCSHTNIVVTSTDPDGDLVSYTIDWGDSTSTTTEWWPSGSPRSLYHVYTGNAVYDITAQAKDPAGAVSGVATTSVNVYESIPTAIAASNTKILYPPNNKNWTVLGAVTDQLGASRGQGASVTFAIMNGKGVLSAPSAMTSCDGGARVTYTQGNGQPHSATIRACLDGTGTCSDTTINW